MIAVQTTDKLTTRTVQPSNHSGGQRLVWGQIIFSKSDVAAIAITNVLLRWGHLNKERSKHVLNCLLPLNNPLSDYWFRRVGFMKPLHWHIEESAAAFELVTILMSDNCECEATHTKPLGKFVGIVMEVIASINHLGACCLLLVQFSVEFTVQFCTIDVVAHCFVCFTVNPPPGLAQSA